MQGMGGTVSSSNPLILAAFESALRHQGLIVLVLLLIAATAWVWPYTAPKPRPEPEPDVAETTAKGAIELGEHPARKFLRLSFGVLWIFDGLLQLQQAMPVGLPTDVVQPAAASSPSWVQHLVNDGTLIWSRHPISAAASTVWIQVGIGVLLLVARSGRLSRLAGAVSVGWGLVVWVFGEAFGGLFGSGLSWLFGAPGAVLFYVVAGALIALPERAWMGQRLGRGLLGVLGVFFIAMAVLQAWPGRGFWQGQSNPHASPGALTSMVQTMSKTPQPHALSSVVSSFGSFDAQHGWAVNLFIVVALAVLGIALLSGRDQVIFVSLVCSSVLCIAVWVFVQDLGFLGGLGTDPNSMIPTVLLIGAGYMALTRQVAPAVLRTEPVRQKSLRTTLSSPAALGVTAAVASFGIVLIGAVPMAFASVNTHTDTIVTEAINGQPEPTDTPAAPFELTDQNGASVSLATLKGRTVALTFLDPVCTSDCPLIAQQFRQVDDSLGVAATQSTAFVAVVANPMYLGVQFVQAFDSQENMNMPNWYFLTGSLAQLTAVWNAYGIQVQTIGSGGMAAHSDTTYVIDGAGHLRTILGADPGNTTTDSASFAALLNKEMRAVAAG
ncbi:MAG TPA: SCO family protein [Acidothermaceae bacterium]|nr:SCO family protein [Acidothermaceae bacterium]